MKRDFEQHPVTWREIENAFDVLLERAPPPAMDLSSAATQARDLVFEIVADAIEASTLRSRSELDHALNQGRALLGPVARGESYETFLLELAELMLRHST